MLLNFSLALTPIIIIIIFIYFQDKYEREPARTLFTSFLLGIISVIPAMVIEMSYDRFLNFTSDGHILKTIFYAFIGVGFTEEMSKFLFLRWFIYRHRNFSEPMDGVVYAVFVSMGFAAIENLVYVFSSNEPVNTAIARSMTAVPAHACFAVMMGLYFGFARFSLKKQRLRLLALSILLPTIAHGFYDVFLFLNCRYCSFVTLIFLVSYIIISLKIISRFKKISPFKKRTKFLKIKTRIISKEEREKNDRRKMLLKEKLGLNKNDEDQFIE